MSPAVVREAMNGWQGARGWPSWSLSNHDVIRFPTRLADKDPERAKLMFALLLALRGTPFLYQGDELGLPHADVPFERLRDPEAIAFWPNGIGRDGARTPMPWLCDARMAGFTEADDAWLPLDSRHRALAVDAQEADPGSVLHFARAAIAYRRGRESLRVGDWTDLAAPDDVIAFVRRHGVERTMCAFNLGSAPANVTLPASGGRIGFAHGAGELDGDQVDLGPFSALFVEMPGA